MVMKQILEGILEKLFCPWICKPVILIIIIIFSYSLIIIIV